MNTQPSRDYQRALLGAAAALVGVVVVYIGFVLGLIAFTAWHATAHPDWMQRGFAGSLLYVSPILMGALITLFLIKPLFARQIPPPPSRPINHEEHPRLFQFIGAICREVGSQPPSRVEIDCAINASVRFREGWASLNDGDLTLTIGLPLVAGLPATHLGGVIAHEFGHFRQDAGLRLTFVVRSLSAWLWRVVHERDLLDEYLNASSEEASAIVALPLYLARFGIDLSRRFLRLLLLAGHAACCRLLRQMEFDADQHAIRVAGSTAFCETSSRIRLLNAAWGGSQQLLARAWRERRLPDDLPAYIRHLADSLPESTRKAVEETAAAARTGTFDTHPSDSEREAAASAANLPGKIDLDEPASELFTDFPALCREISREHYTGILGFEPEASRMETTESASAAIENELAGQRVATFYAPGSGPYQLTAGWSEFDPDVPVALAELHATLASCRVSLDAEAASVEPVLQAWQKSHLTQRRIQVARALSAAAIRWDPNELSLPSTQLETLATLDERSREESESAEATLRPLAATVAQRLHAALLLWWHDPAVTRDCPELPAVQEEIRSLEPILRTIPSIAPNLHSLEGLHDSLHAVLSSAARCRDQETGRLELHNLAAQVRAQLRIVLPRLAGIRHPYLTQSGPPVTVREVALRESSEDDGLHGAYSEAGAVRRIVPDLHSRALARLTALAYEAERRAHVGG